MSVLEDHIAALNLPWKVRYEPKADKFQTTNMRCYFRRSRVPTERNEPFGDKDALASYWTIPNDYTELGEEDEQVSPI